MASCKRLAQVDPQIEPYSLYGESVLRVVKRRISLGEEAAALGAAKKFTAEIKAASREDLDLEGPDLIRIIEELSKLVVEALRGATSDANPSAAFAETKPKKPKEPKVTKARDLDGRRVTAGSKVERDLYGRRVNKEED